MPEPLHLGPVPIEGDWPQLFGNLRRFPRETPVTEVVSDGAQWVLHDFLATMKEMGVDPFLAAMTLSVHYTPATEGPGGHGDPLSQRLYPLIFDDQIVAWKVALKFETPRVDALEEGVALR